MSVDWQAEVDRAVDARFDQMVELRRHLHAHPELSGQERESSFLLYQKLSDERLDVRLGPEGRGVIADLRHPPNGDSAPLLALRADIDALHLHDAKSVAYRSQCEGVTHACGHDAHTALVFGALLALTDAARAGAVPMPLAVRGIFQPAEEICTGAREMIDVGALDGVSAILATHMDPSRAVGRIGLRDGVLTANCDEMTITLRGRGGHAARPHEASDPIVAAAQLINALYLFIARRTDSQDAVVVTIGQIRGGDTANVIPEEVVLRGTVRTLDRVIRQRTFDHIQHLAHGMGETCDVRIQVEFGLGAGGVFNDRRLNQLLRGSAREVLGDGNVDEIARPSMGSEDFAFYLDHVPGAMMRVGCASPRVGGSPLHSPTFDVDEEALRYGAKILARSAVMWSREPAAMKSGQANSTGAKS
ncbi:MAG: amidohydrolase [Planctomycetales bacterium]|nr:amidohydrolase [Planctomycetales bacterium]